MKALTIQQPWAWAIFHADPPKLIENRTGAISYRGPLVIHAGRRWSERGAQIVPQIGGPWQQGWHDRVDRVPAGVLLGVVELADVHPDAGCCRPWGESAYLEHGGRLRHDVIHLVLEQPRLLIEPLPWQGQLGLWNVPDDVIEGACCV